MLRRMRWFYQIISIIKHFKASEISRLDCITLDIFLHVIILKAVSDSDLPAILGGGGVELDRNTADECFNRCEENPRCTWYTYDER